MVTTSPRAQRLLQQLRLALTRYTEQGREQPTSNSAKAQRALGISIGRLIQRLRLTLHLTPTHFARRLGIRPQTVHRWETHQVIPRLSQLHRFEGLLNQPDDQNRIPYQELLIYQPPLASVSERGSRMASFNHLGIGLMGIGAADELGIAMSQAKAVWLFGSQDWHGGNYHFRTEVVLKALQRGVHFHYVYPAGSEADRSFQSSLLPWLRGESFTGSVTGYAIREPRLAYQLGLADVPVTWVAIESGSVRAQSGPSKADRARRLAVLLQLEVQEYGDAKHQREGSEAGQDCWIELATSQAAEWLDKLKRLQDTESGKSQAVPKTRTIRTVTV